MTENLDSSARMVTVHGVTVRLPEPYTGDTTCFGLELSRRQLAAAWHSDGPDDPPLNPRIVGLPGVGKTTVALSVAKERGQSVFIMQATSDLRPEDLVIQPVLKGSKEIEYVASPLLAAVLEGGVCVLDEGNRMSEKCWATLAPLLDHRRYIESVLTGARFAAHPDFRFGTTMNDDASAYELPDYITSRLMPRIELEPLSDEEIYASLHASVPRAHKRDLLDLIRLIRELESQGHEASVRDAVLIARYVTKKLRAQESSETGSRQALQEAIELTLGYEAAQLAQKVSWDDGDTSRLTRIRPLGRSTPDEDGP
jgi:MoxR-like ATPase